MADALFAPQFSPTYSPAPFPVPTMASAPALPPSQVTLVPVPLPKAGDVQMPLLRQPVQRAPSPLQAPAAPATAPAPVPTKAMALQLPAFLGKPACEAQGRVWDEASQSCTDKKKCANPYLVGGIGFVLGLLVGYVVAK